MKNQLKLNDLRVRSFATSTAKQNLLRGGSEIIIDDMPDEPTGLGSSCEWTGCSAMM